MARQGYSPGTHPRSKQWVKATQALPAEKQIEAVSKKLMELNPGFDGKVMPKDRKGRGHGVGVHHRQRDRYLARAGAGGADRSEMQRPWRQGAIIRSLTAARDEAIEIELSLQ